MKMLSPWAATMSSFGRMPCRCHCFGCIEIRHTQFRRLSGIISRLRSGQTPHFSQEQTLTWRRKGMSRNITNHRSTQLRGTMDHRGRIRGKGVHETLSEQESMDARIAEADRRHEEEVSKEAMDALKSLSISHWTLEDVIKYEPKPGGESPPKLPSTTTADSKYSMPQSPWAPDDLKRQNYARVWTRKKIAKMETAMALLAIRLCSLLKLENQRPSNLIVLPEAVRPFAKLTETEQDRIEDALDHRLRELRNHFYEVSTDSPPDPAEQIAPYVPSYEHFDDGLHHDLLRDLNASLADLFEGHRLGHLDFRTLTVKICHNLLVSSAPPNVQTMNILLLGLYSSDSYLQGKTVKIRHLIIDWLIEICHAVKIRPNEVTCATILASYRRRMLRHEFIKFVLMMRGLPGSNALMYTKALTLNKDNEVRLSPTEHTNVFRQSVYPSPMVFSEVIKGVVRFYTLADAIRIVKWFTAAEWGLDWSSLRYIQAAGIANKDPAAGKWVWDQIKTFHAAGHEPPVRILAGQLALCVQCGAESAFSEVLSYSRSQLKHITESTFLDMATDVLAKVMERMTDEKLLAYDNSVELDDETRQHLLESGRRLAQDPAMKLAVEGLARSAREGIKKKSEPTVMQEFVDGDRDDSIGGGSLYSNFALHAEGEPRMQTSRGILGSDQLLLDSQGGVDEVLMTEEEDVLSPWAAVDTTNNKSSG